MREIVVEGGARICGTQRIHGAKNAVLPILAATVLNEGVSKIYNCPPLSDVNSSVEILRSIGAKVERIEEQLVVDATNITSYEIPERLMRESRSSIIFLGAIVARMGQAVLTSPGGCEIGARPIDLHIKALRELGAEIEERSGVLHCTAENIIPSEIHLNFPSVGATENAMLMAARTCGVTSITNAAKEPEIYDLQLFLNNMGVHVSGGGTSEIKVYGTTNLRNAVHYVMPDRIVAATYLCAAMITGGEIELTDVEPRDLQAVIAVLRDCGALIEVFDRRIILKSRGRAKPLKLLQTMPHPGFPTDAQALLTAVLSLADGTSVVVENIFENRFRHCGELQRMSADITVSGQTAIINGVGHLRGAKVGATDLRGGAALVIAALAAEGQTVVQGVEFIERGYHNLVEDLARLGANIGFR